MRYQWATFCNAYYCGSKMGSEERPHFNDDFAVFSRQFLLLWFRLFFRKQSFDQVKMPAVFGLLYLAFVCTTIALLFQNIGQQYYPLYNGCLNFR